MKPSDWMIFFVECLGYGACVVIMGVAVWHLMEFLDLLRERRLRKLHGKVWQKD